MKNILYNTGYFFKEAKTIIRLDLLSNVFSLFSTGLIFFILSMVISGWWISTEVMEVIQGESEINIYFDESMNSDNSLQLVEMIQGINGVREARIVDASEAYDRMESILGQEAEVLSFFDDNPFSPFIEAKIYLEEIDPVLGELNQIPEVSHVRDNREVLDRLSSLASILSILGYLVVAAVGISTLVIISHIIRQGIYSNRDQINTLRLLGAPELFIALPFLLGGLLLTLGGGLLASMMSAAALKQVYAQMSGPLPFIPLPPRDILMSNLVILIMSLSASLGLMGSLLGLSSSKNH
ncbi:protein of unknown function DUF214 [Alkaliphilus metalliredigens QYMF]|uniref:Cell division protein FtsX n=1 Tax=Alkaliphilus metalliredigens (strain QYMF) TaxID=293826 RepID=A6TKM7_ALKMQ|nr:permease-like cell division protein FtsX [Alkaliphilus metalliredigens]ABR46745.1 protein of unknown function DUF214 [Alkaliphilus metalliredigens QYMF]